MATLICNGTLFDGTDRDPISRGAVLIEGKTIVAAGPEATVHSPAGARVIDAEGGTIMPGMLNIHDHVSRKRLRLPKPGASFAVQGAQLAREPVDYRVLHSVHNVLVELRSGVTTIMDLGGAGGFSGMSLRRAINEGLVPGPRLLVAGYAICITGGHSYIWSWEADGPVGVRKAVREQIKAGADCVKFMGSGGVGSYPDEDPHVPEFTLEELQAGVEEAHKFKKRTAIHAIPTETVKMSVRAGMDRIEHGVFLDEEAVEMMRKARTDFVPTMGGVLHSPFVHKLGGRHEQFEAIMHQLQFHKQSVRMAVEAGLRIGTGTDTGGEMVEELELIQEAAGVSNLYCLRAATRASAEIAGIADVTGTIEPGKRADLLIVDGQPLERLADLRKPRWVLRDGQLFEGAPMPVGVRMTVLGMAPPAN